MWTDNWAEIDAQLLQRTEKAVLLRIVSVDGENWSYEQFWVPKVHLEDDRCDMKLKEVGLFCVKRWVVKAWKGKRAHQ